MVYNKETNKSGPNNKCCGSIETKSWCQHTLAAEVCNTGIIYRHSPQNTNPNITPITLQPPLREGGYTGENGYYDNQSPSFGHAVSCSLNLTISGLGNKFYCTDCSDLNDTYQSYYYGGWHWFLCDNDSQYDKCGIGYAYGNIVYDPDDKYSLGQATWPPSSSVSRDVYFQLTIKKNQTDWALDNIIQPSSVNPYNYLSSPSDYLNESALNTFYKGNLRTVYKGKSYLGKIFYQASGTPVGLYDSTVNGTGIDVYLNYQRVPDSGSTLTTPEYSGILYCDWPAAIFKISPNNNTNLLENEIRSRYIYNYEPFLPKLCLAHCLTEPAHTGNAQQVIGSISQLITASGNPCHPNNNNLLSYYYNAEWNTSYKTFHEPIGYVVEIKNAYPNSGCNDLNGHHAVLRNLRSSNHTGLVYDKFLYDYDMPPSGMTDPIDCYECYNFNHTNSTDLYGFEQNSCIGNIGISQLTMPTPNKNGVAIVKVLSKYVSALNNTHRVIAAYSGNIAFNQLSSYNNFNTAIDLNYIPIAHYSGVDRCDFNHLSVKLNNLSDNAGLIHRPCLPIPRNGLCEGGKLPDGFMVNFPSNWTDGYSVFPSYSNEQGDPYYKHIYYTGDPPGTLFGSTCTYLAFSLTSTPPGPPIPSAIYFSTTPWYVNTIGGGAGPGTRPTCSGCSTRVVDCADYPGGYPIGNFLLLKTDYTINSTCSQPNGCNGYETPTSIINSSDDGIATNRVRYSYWNECSNTPCDWREMHLYLERIVGSSGINATLRIHYQNWPCTQYDSCVSYSGFNDTLSNPNNPYNLLTSTPPYNACSGLRQNGTTDPGLSNPVPVITVAEFKWFGYGENQGLFPGNQNYFDCNNLSMSLQGTGVVVWPTGQSSSVLSPCNYTWLEETNVESLNSPCDTTPYNINYYTKNSPVLSHKYMHPHWNGGSVTATAYYA